MSFLSPEKEFVLVPSIHKGILNDNFTLVSELQERSQFSQVKNPLNLLNMQEGDLKSAIYIVKLKDFIDDVLEFVSDMDQELEKDFHRMEYYHDKNRVSTLKEFENLLENEVSSGGDEKKLLRVVGLASCLGLPICIVSRGLESPLYLAEMSHSAGGPGKKIIYPMKTTIRLDNQRNKWNVHVTKTIRCCTTTDAEKRKLSSDEISEISSRSLFGTSYGICTLEIMRKAEESDKVYITIDILRVPPVYGETHALLDFRPSIYFSHY